MSNVAGIVTGLQRGGTGGDLAAGASAASLGGKLGSPILGELAGPLAIASGIYNFAESWQSGKTGADALSGAESGAEIGTAIEPGIGTVVGAVIGGAVGALSSAFGGGATDPETSNWQSFINYTGGAKATPDKVNAAVQGLPPGAAFNLLAGVMDIHDNRIPFVNAFGRMGETGVLNGMTAQINSAIKSGKVAANATPQQIYSQVVTPWLNSKGATITPETGGLQLQAVLTSLIGSWQNGSLTSKTVLDSGGSSDINLPAYAGHTVGQTPVAQHTAAAVSESLGSFGGSKSGLTLSAAVPGLLTIPGALGGASAASGASKMADPTNPSATTATSSSGQSDMGAAPFGGAPATAATPMDSSGTSSIGSDLSSLGSGISSFLSSPMGSLTEFGTLAGIGLEQANSQKSTNDQLAGGLTATGAPYTAAGAAELSQLEGGPQVGGPLGTSIAQQTAAARNLGDIAQSYSTGQLTADQNTQVQQYVSQQKAQAIQELSNSGITDPNSQQYKTAMQQIDDNAATLTQQLVTQNTQMATGALSAVQTTYNNLLTQALNSSEFGFSTQEAGVQTQIQSDTQLATSLNQLFAGIAQGVGTAMGGGNKGGGSSGVAGQIAGVASSVAGGAAAAARAAGSNPSALSSNADSGLASAQQQENADLQQSINQGDQSISSDLQNQLDQQSQPQVNMPDENSSPFDTSGTGPVFSDTGTYDAFTSGDPFGG